VINSERNDDNFSHKNIDDETNFLIRDLALLCKIKILKTNVNTQYVTKILHVILTSSKGTSDDIGIES